MLIVLCICVSLCQPLMFAFKINLVTFLTTRGKSLLLLLLLLLSLYYLRYSVMQTEIAKTFYSRLLPMREVVDSIKSDVLNSVHQELKSVISDYRFVKIG